MSERGKGWDEINMCYYDDDDEDELYDSHQEGYKHSEDYEDFEYEKEDDLLEGESLDFANDKDIETIQVPLDNKNDNQIKNKEIDNVNKKETIIDRPTEPKKIIIKTQNMNVNVNIPKDFISQSQKPNYMKKFDNNMNYERSNNNNFTQSQNYYNNQMNNTLKMEMHTIINPNIQITIKIFRTRTIFIQITTITGTIIITIKETITINSITT